MTGAPLAVDLDFKHAVFAAARRKDAARLVEFLRGERPIGRGERDMLADLVAGNLARPRGNPIGLKHADVARRAQAVARVAEIKKDRKAKGLSRLSHDDVIEMVVKEAKEAKERPILPDQLREWVRNPRASRLSARIR